MKEKTEFEKQIEYLQMINEIRKDRERRLRRRAQTYDRPLESGLHHWRNTDPY